MPFMHGSFRHSFTANNQIEMEDSKVINSYVSLMTKMCFNKDLITHF